jgi:hypothetical protein
MGFILIGDGGSGWGLRAKPVEIMVNTSRAVSRMGVFMVALFGGDEGYFGRGEG